MVLIHVKTLSQKPPFRTRGPGAVSNLEAPKSYPYQLLDSWKFDKVFVLTPPRLTPALIPSCACVASEISIQGANETWQTVMLIFMPQRWYLKEFPFLFIFEVLLMAEILHHLGCINPFFFHGIFTISNGEFTGFQPSTGTCLEVTPENKSESFHWIQGQFFPQKTEAIYDAILDQLEKLKAAFEKKP